MSNPDRIDLNLLHLLRVLLDAGSVSLAAGRLRLSQPTVSEALSRLRAHFGNELFVREGRGFVPTLFARELVETMRPHLDGLFGAARAAVAFDPSVSRHVFRLGCTDAAAFAILPELSRTIRQEAPCCEIVVRTGDYRLLPGLLASGEIDAALGYLRDAAPNSAKIKVLRHSAWVVLRDKSQSPLGGLDDFCARPHVLVTPSGELSGFVDEGLAKHGRQRSVIMGVTAFALLLSILPGSDLLATVPEFVATKLASLGSLAIEPCPVAIPLVANSLAWRIVTDREPAERWFREEVTRIFNAATEAQLQDCR